MEKEIYIKALRRIGVLPVVRLENEEDAVPLAKALREGWINAAEITFRTDATEKGIASITAAFPDMLIGAGTVLTTEQADKATSAGAKFCVAPGLNEKVAEHCRKINMPYTPGVSGATEIEKALELGIDFVKFFPAEQAGGLPFLKAMASPFGTLRFMPTGGIGDENFTAYLEFDKVVCCGGSWLVPEKLIKARKWSEITALCRKTVNKMLDFSIEHIGINCKNEEEAARGTEFFGRAFSFVGAERNKSVFAGTNVRFMKSSRLGENGYIAIGTPSLERAEYHLRMRGFDVDESTRSARVVYLKDRVCGFAVHLIQK